MKKLSIFLLANLLIINFACLTARQAFSQNGVSINATGTAADNSAMLDVSSTTKGLLIPRVLLLSTTDVATISNPANSLLVYNTNPVMIGGGVGFWYYDTSIPAWMQAIGPQGSAGPTGATGTNGPTGATGTNGTNGTDGATGASGIDGTNGATGAAGPVGCASANYIIKSDGTNATCTVAPIYEDAGGLVGIGTTSPAQKIDVVGNIQFSGDLRPSGTPGTSGQLLVSQGAGTSPIWQTPASIPMYGNNAQSVKLAALVTNNTTGSYSDISGMSITMTTVHNVVYVFASFTARLDQCTGVNAQYGQAIAFAQIVVDGTAVACAGAVITDYDDIEGVVTSGTVAFAGIPVTLAPGSHTIKLQWQPVILWADSPWCIVINPVAGASDHCILTIFD